MKFIKNILILLNPSYWHMNNCYSYEWDKHLNYLLDNFEYKNIDYFKATLGNTELWIANFPYSCFTKKCNGFTVRPSRLTIKKAIDKLDKQIGMSLEEYLVLKSIKETV